MAQVNANEIANQLKNYASILLVCGGAPSVDSLGSTLALSLALQAAGKSTQVLTKNPIRAEHSRLVGSDRVSSEISGQKSYVIAIPDAVDAIEKVSCYAEGTKLNIVLQPYADVKDFDLSTMQYSKIDGSFDAAVLIDVPNMQEVNTMLGDQAQLLQQVPVYAIGKLGDNRLQNRLIDGSVAATAQIVLQILKAIQVPLNADIAGNLLQAIYAATNDFHNQNITPGVFEDAAKLLEQIHRDLGRAQLPVSPPAPKAPPPPVPGMMPQSMSRPQQPPQQQMPRQPIPPMPRQQTPMGSMPMAPQPLSDQEAYRPAMPPMPRPNPPIPRPNPVMPAPQPTQPREVAREYEMEQNYEVDLTGEQGYGHDAATEEAMLQARQVIEAHRTTTRETVNMRTNNPNQSTNQQRQNQNQNQNQPKQNRDRGQNQRQNQNPQNQKQNSVQESQAPSTNEPEDWLAPKIYKTEDLL